MLSYGFYGFSILLITVNCSCICIWDSSFSTKQRGKFLQFYDFINLQCKKKKNSLQKTL